MVVYRRTNTKNGKVYIGKTTRTATQRWTSLLAEVKRGGTNPIHNAIRKYGADAFVTDVIYEAKTFDELNAMETFFVVLHQSRKTENGYNLTLGGDGASPGELNPMWGKTHTDEVKAKLRALRVGTKNTPESNEKRRQAELGSQNHFYGKTHSTERALEGCRKGGRSHLGKTRPMEVGQKISKALTGIVRSEATRKRISQAKLGQGLGRKHTPEAIERIREIKRLWWAQRKGGKATVSSLLST
jgi:group I intron endonuclease